MDIKKLVAYYVKKFGTRDPFKIAKCLNIELQIGPIGKKCGCYLFMKNHRCIFERKPERGRKACSYGSRARSRHITQETELLFYQKQNFAS